MTFDSQKTICTCKACTNADRVNDLERQVAVMKAALERIANHDYRGNRSSESCIAREALAKLDTTSEPNPVMKDGKLENFMVKVKGQTFRCSCGSNVFHKPDDRDLNLYRCNGCSVEISGDYVLDTRQN